MSGRTYAVIFFFWAALTIITPTLVFLTETSKPYSDSNGEKIEGVKVRRMIEIIGYAAQHQRTETSTQALAPAPISEQKPASEMNLGEVLLESLRFVINNTKFKLS